MIITRKIECYVAESDPNLKKGYVSTLYSWLRDVRKAANMIVAHKFVQCQMSDFANIDDELREKFIGTKKFVFPSVLMPYPVSPLAGNDTDCPLTFMEATTDEELRPATLSTYEPAGSLTSC